MQFIPVIFLLLKMLKSSQKKKSLAANSDSFFHDSLMNRELKKKSIYKKYKYLVKLQILQIL